MRKLSLNHRNLPRKPRLLLGLLALLLALPQTAWGEEVTKTITFNKQVDAVTTEINNSSMSVSITEQVTGGSSTSSDGTVNILDSYRLLSSYSCTPNNGAVFTLKETAEKVNSFTIEIPGTYPSTPTQVTLTVAYNNSGDNTNTENAKINVGDYGFGDRASTQPQSGAPVTDFYHYYHPYRSNATSMPETTLTYTANNTSGLGTNRDAEKSLIIAVSLNGSASFTIKEATITYNRNPLDINWKLGGSVVTNASVTFGENYSLPQLDVSNGYIGTITYESNNSTVAIVGTSGDVTPLTSGETVITATAPKTDTFTGGTASYTLTVNKATPTMTFSKRQQTGDNNPGAITSTHVGDNETLTTTCGSTFYAPKPTFTNGHALSDSTRFVYSYSVDGVVVFPNNGENTDNPGKINYGEISLLKAGTVTITCSFPGNLQNKSCSASYTLKVNKGTATFAFPPETSSKAYIDLEGAPQWGEPYGAGGAAPTLSKSEDATAITYTSSDTGVATVDAEGNVTPVGKGKTTITAKLENDEKYENAQTSYDLTVLMPATISFNEETVNVVNTGTEVELNNVANVTPSDATVSYTIGNEAIGSIDSENGKVTLATNALGTTTVTAAITALPNGTTDMPQYYYIVTQNTAFQASYELIVSKTFDVSNIFAGESMTYATYYNTEGNMTLPSGLKAYYINGVSDNSVTIAELEFLPQNVPMLLEKTGEAIGTVTTHEEGVVPGGNLLQYAESDVNTSTANLFVLYKNEFVKATGTIAAGKCYLNLSGTGYNGSRGLFIGGNGTTSIDTIKLEAADDNTEWFDLQGRRLQKPTKPGLYIVNGKKVIINK